MKAIIQGVLGTRADSNFGPKFGIENRGVEGSGVLQGVQGM